MEKVVRGISIPEGVRIETDQKSISAQRMQDGTISVSVQDSVRRPGTNIPLLRGVFGFFSDVLHFLRAISEKTPAREMVRPMRLFRFCIVSPGWLAFFTAFWILTQILLFMFVIPWGICFAMIHWFSADVNTAGLLCGLLRAILLPGLVRCIAHTRFIRRLAMYRGAFGKVMNCVLQGKNPDIENALACSRLTGESRAAFCTASIFIALLVCSFVPTRAVSPFLSPLWKLLILFCSAAVVGEITRICAHGFPVLALRRFSMFFENLTVIEPNTDILEVALKAFENTEIPKAEEQA